jgi:hypothetical protein
VKWRPTTSWAAWWQAIAFPVLRDIAAVGTGLYLIVSQNQSASPNTTMVTAGLILFGGVGAYHGYQLLAGPSSTRPGGPSSSEPAPPGSSSPASSSSPLAGPDEGGHG